MTDSKPPKILDVDTIRRLMSDRKISQVARQTGVHQNTLYRILGGKTNPSYNTLKALSEYLTATPEEIINRDGVQAKSKKRPRSNAAKQRFSKERYKGQSQ